jgi:DNA-binding IclR family transcriptional regulator
MSITRRTVLEQLATASDAERKETTSVEALTKALEADRSTIEAHLNGLEACELARREANGSVRVTITGEQLLELDTDEMLIVDASTPHQEYREG